MDCRNFEISLWESPSRYRQAAGLSSEMNEHLQQCLKCREIYADFLKLFALANEGLLEKDSAYWELFHKGVWDKIELAESSTITSRRKRPILSRQARGPAQIRNLAISFGLSIAAVVFFFLNLPDLTEKMVPPGQPLGLAESGKGTPAVQLAPPQSRKIILKKHSPELAAGAGENHSQEFSILPTPQVSVVSDSALVSIDAVYLTDQDLDKRQVPVRRALSHDIVEGRARAQTKAESMQPQQLQTVPPERIITLEKMPHMKKAVPPDYPPLAYKLKKGGEVWIKARIDANGSVTDAQIYRSSGTNYGFDEAALKAASLNQFEPFEVDNQKLPIWVIYKVRFVINE